MTEHAIDPRRITRLVKMVACSDRRYLVPVTGATHRQDLTRGRVTDELLRMRFGFIGRAGVPSVTILTTDTSPRVRTLFEEADHFILIRLMASRTSIRRFLSERIVRGLRRELPPACKSISERDG